MMSTRRLISNLIFRSDKDFWTASFLGSLIGGFGLFIAKDGLPAPQDWWQLPLVALSFALFALPFTAFGLAVLGLPATALLQRYAQSWWAGALAALIGALAGKLMFQVLDKLLFKGVGPFGSEPGVMFGLPTAIVWWWLLRRRSLERAPPP